MKETKANKQRGLKFEDEKKSTSKCLNFTADLALIEATFCVVFLTILLGSIFCPNGYSGLYFFSLNILLNILLLSMSCFRDNFEQHIGQYCSVICWAMLPFLSKCVILGERASDLLPLGSLCLATTNITALPLHFTMHLSFQKQQKIQFWWHFLWEIHVCLHCSSCLEFLW